MPIEKTENYIRIRVANPKQFIRFRVKLLGKGIRAVIGFMKKGGSKIQSLLFPRSKYTIKTARAWVKSHGYSVQETYIVTDVLIDPKTHELVLEETLVEDLEEINVDEMDKEMIEWLAKE